MCCSSVCFLCFPFMFICKIFSILLFRVVFGGVVFVCEGGAEVVAIELCRAVVVIVLLLMSGDCALGGEVSCGMAGLLLLMSGVCVFGIVWFWVVCYGWVL